MDERHNHARDEQLDSIVLVDPECAQPVIKVSTLLVPSSCGFPLFDVIPLLPVSIKFHMTTETLRCPLAVTGGAFKAHVVEIVCLTFGPYYRVTVTAFRINRVALVHSIAGRAH